MEDFVNKIRTKDGTEYEIQDARIESVRTDEEIKALAKEEVESAESGTIADALGLDS